MLGATSPRAAWQAWPPAGYLLAVGLVLCAKALSHRWLLPPVNESGYERNDYEQVDEQHRPGEQQCLSDDGHEVGHVHGVAHVPVRTAGHHLARRRWIGRERRPDALDGEPHEGRDIH